MIEGCRLNKQSPTVLSYATPGSQKPGGLPPPPWYRRSLFWMMIRRITFALGMFLLGAGIGGVLMGLAHTSGDFDLLTAWGMALIGICIPLGPLPWFMREDDISGRDR